MGRFNYWLNSMQSYQELLIIMINRIQCQLRLCHHQINDNKNSVKYKYMRIIMDILKGQDFHPDLFSLYRYRSSHLSFSILCLMASSPTKTFMFPPCMA